MINNGNTTGWVSVENRRDVLCPDFFFIIIIDWIMRKRGTRWKFTFSLENLDYADDLALLQSNHQDIQEKSNMLKQAAKYIGINININ